MADPDLELRGRGGGGGEREGGLDSLALLAFFHSVISSFLTKITGGPGPPLDTPLILIGNAAFYLSSSPANTIGNPVLWTTVMSCWNSWAINIPSYRLVSLHVSIS